MSLNHVAVVVRLHGNAINNQFDSKAKIAAAQNIQKGAMNNYYQLAEIYFQRFEKADFLPKCSDIRMLLFALFTAIFLLMAYLLFANNEKFSPAWFMYVALYGSEGAAILAAHSIINRKQKTMIASFPEDENLDDEQKIHHARRAALVEITGKQPSEFLVLLQEIKKLKDLEQQHRSQLDPDFWKSLWAFLTHPFWLKALSGLLVVGSFLFGVPEKLFNINLAEIINNKQTIAKLLTLLQFLISSVFLAFISYLLTRQLLELTRILISIRWPSKQGSATTLNYFMRDLIKYYSPAQKAPPIPPTPVQPTQSQIKEQAKATACNGFLIALLAVQAAYAAWRSSKHNSAK